MPGHGPSATEVRDVFETIVT